MNWTASTLIGNDALRNPARSIIRLPASEHALPGVPGDDHAVATILVTRTRSNGATLTG
jgi:hypothetical protein